MRAILALLVSTCLAAAQEGGPLTSRHGVGHDSWHEQFYSKLVTNDGHSCCNLNDCRPTFSRSLDNHYEVLVDGEWTAVPPDTIRKVVAPDEGAHVCAPQRTHDWGVGGSRRGRSPNESEVLMRTSSRQATEGAKHAMDNSTVIACTSR